MGMMVKFFHIEIEENNRVYTLFCYYAEMALNGAGVELLVRIIQIVEDGVLLVL